MTLVGDASSELARIDGTCPSPVDTPHLRVTLEAGDAKCSSLTLVTSSAFSLGFSIEPKLQDRIRCGLFIPFDIILISEQGGLIDQYLETLSVAPTTDSHNRTQALALSIDRWTDAFFIFMAIWIDDKPWDAPTLLQCMHIICSMARNAPGPLWLHYDWEFHLWHQYDPLLPWGGCSPTTVLSNFF